MIVDEDDGRLTGFVCVQLKKSFCYNDYRPEIAEVYVRPEYRKQKIASRMIGFAEEYCRKNFPLHKFELLTVSPGWYTTSSGISPIMNFICQSGSRNDRIRCREKPQMISPLFL